MASSNDAAPAIDKLIERADKVIARATTYEREIDAVEPLVPPEHPDLFVEAFASTGGGGSHKGRGA